MQFTKQLQFFVFSPLRAFAASIRAFRIFPSRFLSPIPRTSGYHVSHPGSYSWPMRKFIPTQEWEDERQILGLQGEREAMAYLISCGYEIEDHRHKLGRHDIDLIVRRGNIVAFVEVKTRRGHAYGTPLEAVGRRKQATIAKVADLWRIRFGRPSDIYRFDLVAVDEGPPGKFVIQHVENAWRLER
jgi:putative endonuclease